MYIKTKCPICGGHPFHDLTIYEKETLVKGRSTREIVKIDVTDSCSPEELSEHVVRELSGHVYDGITALELCKILREKFGVLEQYCCDIVQLLKIRMHMYCPDRQHLYYV